MTTDTVTDVDTQIVNARWQWLHCVWEQRVHDIELARVAVDVLLERRHELMLAAAPAG
jgi:hypothetical protein